MKGNSWRTFSEKFDIRSGVSKACLMSPFIFPLAIKWIMKTVTSKRWSGKKWTLWSQLHDLNLQTTLQSCHTTVNKCNRKLKRLLWDTSLPKRAANQQSEDREPESHFRHQPGQLRLMKNWSSWLLYLSITYPQGRRKRRRPRNKSWREPA